MRHCDATTKFIIKIQSKLVMLQSHRVVTGIFVNVADVAGNVIVIFPAILSFDPMVVI